ncbi:unnamed protein product [Agarophyton chilense]
MARKPKLRAVSALGEPSQKRALQSVLRVPLVSIRLNVLLDASNVRLELASVLHWISEPRIVPLVTVDILHFPTSWFAILVLPVGLHHPERHRLISVCAALLEPPQDMGVVSRVGKVLSALMASLVDLVRLEQDL